MKKKIFVGLLSCALVCLAFVFTNASSDSFSVSGSATVYQDDSPMSWRVQIDVTSQDPSNSFSTRTNLDGSFDLTLHHNDEVTFSYTSSDNSGSVSESRIYTSEKSDESIDLYYVPGSHRVQ